MIGAVSADHRLRTSSLNGAVQAYDIVIAYLTESARAVHRIDIRRMEVPACASGRAVDDDGIRNVIFVVHCFGPLLVL